MQPNSYIERVENVSMEYHNTKFLRHYDDVIMGAISSRITSLTIVSSTVYLDLDQTKHQSSVSLAFVRGIHWRPVNSPHKCPVTRKMFPFDDVIMTNINRDISLSTHPRWSHAHLSDVTWTALLSKITSNSTVSLTIGSGKWPKENTQGPHYWLRI